MRKTNKNLTKQILTLMLAFVMVFTGMRIGNWGVDEAWAASSSNRYTVQEVIGFTKESLDAQNLFYYYGTPPAGDGQKIGTFNAKNLYYIGLGEEYTSFRICNTTLQCSNMDPDHRWEVVEASNYDACYAGSEILTANACLNKDVEKNGAYYNTALDKFQSARNNIVLDTDCGIEIPQDAKCLLFTLSKEENIVAYALVKFADLKPIEKEELDAAIAKGTVSKDDYYHADDRYNGKTTVKELVSKLLNDETIKKDKATVDKIKTVKPSTGFGGVTTPGYEITSFWQLYQAAMERVDEIYPLTDGVRTLSENVYQKEVDAAAALLDAAADNIIPTAEVNTTLLYETTHTEWIWGGTGTSSKLEDKATSTEYFKENLSEDNCTLATWTPYAQAISEATALLEELFDQDGNATSKNHSTDSDLQAKIKTLVTAADASKLVRQSAYDYTYTQYQEDKTEMEMLLTQYDPKKLTETDYTAESWKRYIDAYTALQETADYRIVGGTTEDYAVLKRFAGYSVFDENEKKYIFHPAQIRELRESRRQLVSADDITVSLTYVNNFSALYPEFLEGGTNLYVNENVLFEKDSTMLTTETLEKAGITFDKHDDETIAGTIENNSDTEPFFLIFINGENYGLCRERVLNNNVNIQLHDGDNVRVVRICQPVADQESSTGYDTSAYKEEVTYDETHYGDSIAQIHMTAPQTVKVGDKAVFSAAVTGVNSANQGKALKPDQISLFISAPQQTSALTEPVNKTETKTDADGKLQYIFTEPGYYTVAMYNVTPDKKGITTIYHDVTAGEYYSLYAGDYAQIYVEPAEDENALLKQYRSENIAKAKAYYESFHDYDFAAGYYAETFKTAYVTLKENQQKAETFKALMEHFEADYAVLENCAAQKLDHTAIIDALRTKLSYIPEELSELNDGDKDFIESVQNAYEALNEYQKTLLTPNEIKKLDKIAALNTETLPIRAIVHLEKAYNDNTFPIKGDNGNPYYGWPNIAWTIQPNPDGSIPEPEWAKCYTNLPSSSKAGNYVFIRKYLNTTDEQYWLAWTIDGWKTTNLAEAQTLITRDLEKAAYSDYYLVKYQIPKDIAENSTITFDLKMISKTEYELLAGITDTPEQIAAAKDAALEALEAAYKAYKSGNYTDENWETLTKAYEKAKTDIGKAATTEAAAEARKAALAAMAAVPVKSTTTPGTEPGTIDFNSGKTVGKVHVIIENSVCPVTESSSKNGNKTEFDTKKAGLYGTFIDDWYDLGEKDTMMSCVLKALQLNGYGWEGTGGDGYGITYIAGIFNDTNKNGKLDVNEKILSEFDGGNGSGWMGTLNDWFNNEGFAAFTAKNGALENGDEIHIMYTTNLGVDIGGTWYNEDTSLKKLEVSGGTLSPAFSGSQTDYTLIISGDKANVSVTPSAANKNYQARIFLNRYNQDSARYKRTESISVKSGDVLYVGVGEKGWPTMNAGGVGTKYTIKVVSSSDSAAVDKMLKSLKKITYANYKAEKGNVEAARAAYNALDAEGKQQIAAADLKKLTDAEAQIKFYSEIDDAKAKLNALTDSSSSSEAKAALSAYEKLTKEQKEYITEADAAKFNELAKKYNFSTITGAAAMPESEVVTTGSIGSAVTTSPTTVKLSGTTASVTVKADNQKEILKQAKEKKSAQVVLAIANSDAKGAEKLELNLEKSFLESLLKDTSAKLVVKTPLGQKTYERDELQKLVNETTGTTVKAEINKDNVDTAAEEPTEENAAKIEKAKSIVKNMKLVARSSKTAKKNIKAVLKSDAKVNASIKELKDLGFTVKYRFYRSTKKAASYKSTVTKKVASYTNTSGKKGTKYFYKVQVRVYDENGKLIAKTALKQCKYASRTWTKAK